jgi:hypothetical protein
MIRKYAFLVLSLFWSTVVFSQEITETEIYIDIAYLSSDKLKGRRTGTKEEMKAAKYIIKEFKKITLTPKGTKGFLYPFQFKYNPNPHDTAIVNLKQEQGHDVVGFLDNDAAKTVVIGAHYDHLGLGHDHNSLDPNPEGKIHNGADDNASGVAGVLALARKLAKNDIKENYNYLFICFSGEELGLHGSKKWCENPTIPLSSINYMINMDMIGRLNDTTNKLMLYGVGTSPTWEPLLEQLNDKFSIKKDSAGIGPSDQTAFYLKDIPVLHFFTGQHSDYHKPSDDVEKINISGEKRVLEYIAKILMYLDKEPSLVFQKTQSPTSAKSSFKVTLGIMPDYTYEGLGLRIDGVNDGRPAHLAGLKAGDVILKIQDIIIQNMQDYMKSLGKFEKGQHVKVLIEREKSKLEKDLVF